MRELDRWRYLRRQRRRRCLDLVVLHRDHRRVSNVARHREACRDVRGRRDVASPRNESPFLGSKAGSANTEMWRSSGIFAEDPAT